MNTSIKQRVGCILLSILLVVCLIGSLLCALILPFMSSNGVAKADSTNGVVKDNLLLNNDFLLYSGTQITNWTRYTSSNISLSRNEIGLNLRTTSTTNVDYAYLLDYNSHIGDTLTFTLCIYYNDTYIYRSLTHTISSETFSISVALIDGTNNRMYFQKSSTQFKPWFRIVGGYSFTLVWCKLEVGSSFTGYVPKDYTNYGYDQGYNEGLQKTNDLFNTIRGYNIVDSFSNYLYKYCNVPLNPMDTHLPWFGMRYSSSMTFFNYLNNYYEMAYETVNIPTYIQVDFLDGYQFKLSPYTRRGYATIPIGLNVSYDGTNLYLCKDFDISTGFNIIIRSVDGNNTIIINQYTVSAYFSNIPVMDLSPYMQSGGLYNIYLSSQTLGDSTASSSFTLITHNTFYTGINSLCLVKVLDSDLIGRSSYEEGRAAGYEQGRLTGYYEGYGDGYSKGELVAPADGQYTFLGVIGALFDAPVNSLKTFLDFDLLGFNMKSFVFAMLTLAFIVLIVRLILGSKL